MSWLFNLSNWLSNGALKEYERQSQFIKAELEETQSQFSRTQAELETVRTQLQENQQIKTNLAETDSNFHQSQQELATVTAELENTQQQLLQTQTSLNQSQQELAKVITELENTRQQQWRRSPVKFTVRQVKSVHNPIPESLLGFGIGMPQGQAQFHSTALIIRGWVLGTKTVVSTVRISCDRHILDEVAVNQVRSFLAQKYPEVSDAERSGFESAISIVGMPSNCELFLEAVFEDRTIIPLANIVLAKEESI